MAGGKVKEESTNEKGINLQVMVGFVKSHFWWWYGLQLRSWSHNNVHQFGLNTKAESKSRVLVVTH